jgi:hypothetical protein
MARSNQEMLLGGESPAVMFEGVDVDGLKPGDCPLVVQGNLRVVGDLDFERHCVIIV